MPDLDGQPVFTKPGLTSLAVADFDRDGYRDGIATGWSSDVLIHWRGQEEGYFGEPLILDAPGGPRDIVLVDMDDDGDLDVVITQINRPPLILRNDQQLGHHWLRVRVGGHAGNRDAIGARLQLFVGQRVLERTVMPTRSYLTQVELPVTFGLAEQTRVERLLVTWPDGESVELTDLPADQVIDVAYPSE